MNFFMNLFSSPIANNAVMATITSTDATAAATEVVERTGLWLVLDKIEYGIMVPMVYFALLFCCLLYTSPSPRD